jgi:4-hydroxy-tetrahydrodipicolinate synthase
MTKYAKGEARAWALSELEGCCGCVLPTFTSDLDGLNETAIRHDIQLEKDYGYKAVLLVSECGTTEEEIRRVVEMGVAEAGDDLVTVAHASEPTLQHTIERVQHAERAGADLILLSYPMLFYPRTEEELFAFTKKVADSTSLGIMIFAMHLWNFGRLHPSDFNPDLMERLISSCDNVAVIKNEIGAPGVGGISEVFERFSDRVVVTDPLEMNSPAWTRAYGMRFMGTSNYECMAGEVPQYFTMLRDDATYAKAMEIYWRLHPMRQVQARIQSEAGAGTNMVHRLVWKYEGWLFGFNGGPIRQPHLRINDGQMRALRAAAVSSGLPVTDADDHEFFVGRNPA